MMVVVSSSTTRNQRTWQVGDAFTVSDATELYEVDRWGKGYFSISPSGHVLVHPTKDPARSIDLKELTDHLQLRGIGLPVLIRFRDILRHRVSDIHSAFRSAIAQHQYVGGYVCVYPIKVNQQRQVVEEVLDFGREYGFGLEAGSKPELLAVAAQAYNDTPIICNGFKDAEFIEMAMLAQKIGRRVIPVVEKYTELGLILKYAEKVGVRPQIGMRVKLAARGGGRWQGSGGYRSKFGLTVTEVLRGLDELRALGMQDCFKLLHFHLGSQIPNIRIVKGALNEAARVYAELVKAGAGLEYLDVGGGLGIDYDGSQTNFESSVNYTLEEYANDVVYHIQTVCDDAGVKHPTIVSESGRAIVAYHSVLIFNVLGVSAFGEEKIPESIRRDEVEQPVIDLLETYNNLTMRNALESYHDAQQALDMALSLFSGGYLPLEQRCQAENLYWAILAKLRKLMAQTDEVPEDLQGLDESLADTYFCNFSLFQSCPDSWAIKQLFPVMPIHRLNTAPTHHAVLGDITCDSDGKIDQFIDRRDVKPAAPHGQGRPVLPGRVPRRRIPGDPGRPAQPVRRHPRGAREPRRSGERRPGRRDQRGYREGSARLRRVRRRVARAQAAQRRRACRPRGKDQLRGVRPPAGVLRRRSARLYLPGRSQRTLNLRSFVGCRTIQAVHPSRFVPARASVRSVSA
jgi:arginine decarboxylase